MDKFSKLTVLFVDEDEAIVSDYREFLILYFKDVFTANDGLEAYRLYDEHKPDIVILDLKLPKLDGVEVLKRIRKSDQNTRIIIFSVNSNQEFIQTIIKQNTTAYLIKPVSRKELKDSLNKAYKELLSYNCIK